MELALLHGWGAHPVIWDPLTAHLPRNWRVRNVPLPGYAGAAAPHPYKLDELAHAVCHDLPDRPLLVGWSLGGLVSMQIGFRWPEMVRGLILIGATPCFVTRMNWPHGVASDVFDGFAQHLALDYEDTLRRFIALQAQGASSMREVLRELRGRLLTQPRPEATVLQGGLAILQETDLRKTLPELPLSIVHGAGDKLAPIGAARWLVNAVRDSRLLELGGAGHAPFLSHPAEVARFIVEVAGA